MARRQKFAEGDWFAVPVGNGEFALGLIARARPRASVLFGYFFPSRFQVIPSIEAARAHRAPDACLVCRFGDHALFHGKWPVIGSTGAFSRSNWPLPKFCRTDLVSGELSVIQYSEDDPGVELSSRPAAAGETAGCPRDELWGSGAVEGWLADLPPTRPTIHDGAQSETNCDTTDDLTDQLGQVGANLGVAHVVDHYLYFAARSDADTVANLLQTQGYSSFTRRGSGGKDWLVRAKHLVVPATTDFDRITSQLRHIAASHRGEYDGWDSQVAPKT